MQKHAYLIMAHTNFQQLTQLLKALDHPRNALYIHVDRKVKHYPKQQLLQTCLHASVTFTDRLHVSWGGFSQIKVELLLFQKAFDNGPYAYYHLLSGLDYPLRPISEILAFFDAHQGYNFVEVNDNKQVTHPKRFELRYAQYHLLQDTFGMKHKTFFKYLDFGSCLIQRFLGIQRSKNISMKSGANWVSITNELVAYLLTNKPKIRHLFKKSYCCDELFIPTLIWPTKFMATLYHNGDSTASLRYADYRWIDGQSTPKTLDITDFDRIQASQRLFGRKFRYPESLDLEQKLTTFHKK